MANRSNNIWAKAAAGSPGTNIARAQQSRWTGIPNEAMPLPLRQKAKGAAALEVWAGVEWGVLAALGA